MYTLKLRVPDLGSASAADFEAALQGVAAVRHVDTWKGRAEIRLSDKEAVGYVIKALAKAGFNCEKAAKEEDVTCAIPARTRPKLFELLGLFGLALLVGSLLSKSGISSSVNAQSGSFVGSLLLGLVAGSSSCLAVSGGLLLSSAGKYRERYGSSTAITRVAPAALFVGGRVLSYALFGGLISLIGYALTPSPLMTGIITVLAALYMLVMGLEMLHLAPSWLSRLAPRMPKALSNKVLDAEGREHPVMPALLGAGTFFLPCGFTQTLQVYALTTGSFWIGALILGGFALGTAPALMALGWASTSLKGKAGSFFLKFSGAVVIVLGLTNVQNGLTAAGYPLDLSSIADRFSQTSVVATDANVEYDGQTQVIRMKLGSNPFYSPSDHYTVRQGVPVRMEIEGIGEGCRSIFQIPKFGVQVALAEPLNIIEFTPDKPGDAVFSCSMGMFKGGLTVVPFQS